MSTLFGVFKVHCFWGWCDHIVTGLDSDSASSEMQMHYDEKHEADLDRLGYGATARYLKARSQ